MKIVIQEDPALQSNLSSLKTASTAIVPLIQSIKAYQKTYDIILVVLQKEMTLKDFIKASNSIPNQDRIKQFNFRIDFLNDCKELEEQTRNLIADRDECKFSGTKLDRDQFKYMLSINMDLIESLIQSKREFDTWIDKVSPNSPLFELISISNEKLIIADGAEQSIIRKMTSYASPRQIEAFNRINEALSQIASVEKDFNAPGLLTSSINFDKSQLAQIKS